MATSGPRRSIRSAPSSSRSTPTNESRRSYVFDLDDIDAAFAELDARYLAGEAAPHAHTWSVVARNIEAFNRHELPAWTPDVVNIDHRKVTAFALGDQTAYIRATWDQTPDLKIYIDSVHRLNDLGAVIAYAAHGTSQEGFDAEWRGITISMIDGDRVSHSEQFNEDDIDTALARFDELSRPAPRLENAASRVYKRICSPASTPATGTRLAELMAAGIYRDDRRRVISAGTIRSRRSGNRGCAGGRRHGGSERCVDRHRDPRGAPRPHPQPLLGPRPPARGVQHRGAVRHRARSRRTSRRIHHVRP